MSPKIKILMGILAIGIIFGSGYWIWNTYQISKEKKGSVLQNLYLKNRPVKNILIEKITGGGWTPLLEEQITPDFRLYEDGMVVYKKFLKPDVSKFELMIGHLTKKEISELVKFIADQGFFEMADRYSGGVMDGADITITVKTKQQSKTVRIEGFGLSVTSLKNFEKIWKRLFEFKVPFARKYRPKIITLFVSSPIEMDIKKIDLWPSGMSFKPSGQKDKVTLEGNDLEETMKAMENEITKPFSYQGKGYFVTIKIHFPDE